MPSARRAGYFAPRGTRNILTTADNDKLHRAAAASEAALAPYAILDTAPEAEYDDLAHLAGDLCGTPVALLTLFESSRQWFKAKVGFDGGETTLDDAICRHALDVEDILVIPDLSRDPRTADNALVTDGPEIRFYAGAPLRAPDGTFLGTLCVIDFVARPDGLTAAQVNGLQVLARQVMSLLELRRLLRERDAALDAGLIDRHHLAKSEAHWRGLFEGMREGFMVGEVVRDPTGKIVDWRHLEVNPAFLDVVGMTTGKVIGQTVRTIAPAIPQGWIDYMAGVVVRAEPATFNQAIGSKTYEGRAFPIGEDQFAVIFLDVTERTLAAGRQAALIALGDQMTHLDRVEDMAALASRIVGETLGVRRVGYGRLDPQRETIMIEPDWTAPGVASIAGVHRFSDYGDILNELLVGEPLVIYDARTDPRTAADPGPMEALGIRALVNMPIRERDRTAAVLIVHDDRARVWTSEELVFLRYIADRLELGINRLEVDARRLIQNQELSHRVKNTLAMVQAIASQTLKPVEDRATVANFERRLSALATAHDVLLGNDWEAATLELVIKTVLLAAGQEERVAIDGPSVELSPRAVLSTSLLIHELATNAVKYGALSTSAGLVAMAWKIRNRDGRLTLFLEWIERGGPPAVAPARRGFGSRLINMGLVGTGGVDLSYASTGLSIRMSAPLDDLTKQ